MLAALIEEVRQSCEQSLQHREMVWLEESLRRSGRTRRDCAALVSRVNDDDITPGAIAEFKRSLTGGKETEEGLVERFLILHGVLEFVGRIPELPVVSTVKKLFCEQFLSFARDEASKARYRSDSFLFVVMGKQASLRLFPAGELYWEVGGLPRSRLLKLPPLSLPIAVYFLYTKFKGVKPAFFYHLNPLRKIKILVPKEMHKSLYLMAKSLALQPQVKGIYTTGWLQSPDTIRASPHLAWRNKVFEENGGLILGMKEEGIHKLVFENSPERKKLYEEGKFKPTNGLVMWAAQDALRWAAQHPELAE